MPTKLELTNFWDMLDPTLSWEQVRECTRIYFGTEIPVKAFNNMYADYLYEIQFICL